MKASETNLLRLIQGSKVFLVPNFQRRYSWRRNEWTQLWDDLLREYRRDHDVDSTNLDGHFLGSIVLHPAPGKASMLMKHLVVDGQQRLTTTLTLIAALRDVGRELELDDWNPDEYNSKYLINPFDDQYPDRLVPTKLDRDAYVQTIRKGIPTDGIGQAYTFFAKKIRESAGISTDHIDRVSVRQLAETLLLRMLVVEINTTSSDSVNNIFNRLNSKGMQLSAADLVRNELLLNLDDTEADAAFEQYWLPMEQNLVRTKKSGDRDDRDFVTFLWAREVAYDASTTRLNLFLTFERRFRADLRTVPLDERTRAALSKFEEIHRDHHLYMVMQRPFETAYESDTITFELRAALDRIRRWRSEPVTPFAFWILKECTNGTVTASDAAEAIDLVLGYLVRRTLAGIPTNQLNRLLTPLSRQLSNRGNRTVSARLREILSQSSYRCPSDPEVLSAVQRTPIFLSARKQLGFILTEIERLLEPMELHPKFGLAISHVMPQGLPGHWTTYVLEGGEKLDDAISLVHTLGNLTLTAVDEVLSEQSFLETQALLSHSPLRLNSDIAGKSSWLPSDIEDRSTLMARLLLASLPDLETNSDAGGPTQRRLELADRLEAALQTIPEGGWIEESDLIELLGVDSRSLREMVGEFGPEIARLVRDESGTIPEWLPAHLSRAVAQQDIATSAVLRVSAEELIQLMSTVEEPSSTNDYADTQIVME